MVGLRVLGRARLPRVHPDRLVLAGAVVAACLFAGCSSNPPTTASGTTLGAPAAPTGTQPGPAVETTRDAGTTSTTAPAVAYSEASTSWLTASFAPEVKAPAAEAMEAVQQLEQQSDVEELPKVAAESAKADERFAATVNAQAGSAPDEVKPALTGLAAALTERRHAAEAMASTCTNAPACQPAIEKYREAQAHVEAALQAAHLPLVAAPA